MEYGVYSFITIILPLIFYMFIQNVLVNDLVSS